MKRYIIGLIILFALGAMLYFGALLPERWQTEEREREQKAGRAWEDERASRARVPAQIIEAGRLIDAGKLAEADRLLIAIEKSGAALARAQAAHRRAEIQYMRCERHLINFDHYYEIVTRPSGTELEKKQAADNAGEERDKATAACALAEKKLGEVASPSAEFYRHYATGNTAVRKAMTAVTAEAQEESFKAAITSYRKALMIHQGVARSELSPKILLDRDHAKMNLELLLCQQKNAQSAAAGQDGKNKQPLDPKQFKLKPTDQPGKGASSGTAGRSRL